MAVPVAGVRPRMQKIVPEVLKDHVLPFNWDVRKVWNLQAEVVEVPSADFEYLLQLPLWSSIENQGLLFDICPIDVIRNPSVSPYQALRLDKTALQHPIDVLVVQGKRWILDGIHRIAKNFILKRTIISVRFHDESISTAIRAEIDPKNPTVPPSPS